MPAVLRHRVGSLLTPPLREVAPAQPGSEGVDRTGKHPQSLRDSPLQGAITVPIV